MRHPWSIARRTAATLLLLLSAIALLSGWAAYLQARQTALDVEERHVLGVASLVAQEDQVQRAAVSPAAARDLQRRIPEIMGQARVSWMTVMDPTGMRVASWHPEQVGVPYPLPVDRAVAGGSWTEVSTTGAAGRSVRAVVPVRDPATGTVAGVLTMGVQVSELDIVAAAQLPRLALTFALTAAVGAVVAYAVGRYLHRVTLGRGPEDLAEAFLLSEAAMDSMGAGVLVLSPDGRVRQHNAAADRLLGMPPRGRRAPRRRPSTCPPPSRTPWTGIPGASSRWSWTAGSRWSSSAGSSGAPPGAAGRSRWRPGRAWPPRRSAPGWSCSTTAPTCSA